MEEIDAEIVETTVDDSQENSDYEAQMLEAFVGKPDEPERGLWYANAFAKFNNNGVDSLKWVWSWWAFGGGIWFLLYRKAYAPAGALLLASLLSNFIPFSGLIIWILTGGYSTYFVYKVYKTKKEEIERVESDPRKRIEMMRELGGYNQWALVVAVVLNVLVLVGFSYFAFVMMSSAAAGNAY